MYEPDFLTTPGEVLEEYLESYSMSQAELAERTGLTSKTINLITRGRAPISTETAIKLEKVLGRPAHFWNNLELIYQEDKARLEEKAQLESYLEWLKTVPIAAMSKLGWIQKFKNPIEQLNEVLRFFGIASPAQWEAVWKDFKVAYRQSSHNNSLAISAWLRQGELEAQQIMCGPFEKTVFKEVLEQIRALTIMSDPSIFVPELKKLCANAGVAVVFLPELPKCGVYGCTRWIGDKPIIQLSLRYKSNDHLWFTFFHEAGHIIKHGKKDIFIEGNGMQSEKEEEANVFASDHLIPQKALRKFVQDWNGRSLDPIIDFANQINIAPGIVVGRLQHDGKLDRKFGNKLKVFYHWETN